MVTTQKSFKILFTFHLFQSVYIKKEIISSREHEHTNALSNVISMKTDYF